MKAIVIGAGRKWSIGAAIVAALKENSFDVVAPTHAEVDVMYCNDFMEQHDDARILVLSHGTTSMASFEMQTRDDIKRVIDTNITGTILAAQWFVRNTIAYTSERKSIFIIGSLGGSRVFTNSSVYCASKAAVAHLGRCMAWELSAKGFDVYVIEPGNVSGTPMSQCVVDGMIKPELFAIHSTREAIIKPEEVASVVLGIITNNMTWLSGEPIRLTGGAR
jgi:NADP-dependent 3-hydroxy acid dehydrogenase YdfG